MSLVMRGARYLRHLPILERQEKLWNLLRKPYRSFLSLGRSNVMIQVSGAQTIEIPSDFLGMDFAKYEVESVWALRNWVIKSHDALFVDVGSSIGIFSAVALSASQSIRVIAIDSDIESISAVERVCAKHLDRCATVWGFISDHGREDTLEYAILQTQARKAVVKSTGAVSKTRYICIDGNTDQDIPFYTIDNFFRKLPKEDEVMIKIDVEGAELLVLKGAERFIGEKKPLIMLSVHPDTVGDYNTSVDDIKIWLESHAYTHTLIAVDHEEHWICKCSSE